MTSATKQKSNRANALKSTGPKTAEGKSRVSGNALQHGMLSRHLIVAGERQEDFDTLLARMMQELEPVGLVEMTLVERVAVAIWRQRRLVRAESAQITLGNLDHSDMAASHVAPYLGRDWNDKLVRSVVAERPEDIPDYAPDDVLEELAIFQAAFDSGIVDLAQLEEKFPLPYEVIFGFAGAQGPAAYLARHFSSLRELLGNFIRQYQDKLAGFEVRRVLQLYRESRALPAAPEILSRYQSALDTKDHHP